MRDGVLSFLKIFGILSFVTSLSNLFGLLGGLNALCDGKQCTDSATRINWLDLHNITNSSGWSESFPSIGVPDVAAITFSFAIVIFAFKEYITTLLHGKVDGQIAEPRMIIENDSDDKLDGIYYNEYKDGTFYIMGNGGSSGIAEGFSVDLRTHPFVSEDKTQISLWYNLESSF